MGANAQIAVPAFTAGQVLTAAQQTQINTGIPVFATTTTRDAAFGGTGEKVLAEGQYAYIESTNETLYYDGSSWIAVGKSGLNFISSTTFTTAASVSLPVGTFSSTYFNYLVLVNLTAASTNIALTGRLRIAGADNTAASYATILTGFGGNNTAYNVGNSSQTSFTLRSTNSSPDYSASFTFMNPFDALRTHILTQIASNDPGVALVGSSGVLTFDATTSFDSFSIICNTGTISGTVKVYGYANS